MTVLLGSIPTAARATVEPSPSPEQLQQRKQAIVQMQREGRYEEAADALEDLHAIEPTTGVLYNWAQAERLAGHCDQAILLYRRVIDELAQTSDELGIGANARQRLRECEEQVAAAVPPDDEPPLSSQTPEPTTVPAPTAEPPATDRSTDAADASSIPDDEPRDTRWHRDPLGGALVGVGGVILATAAGLTIASRLADARADGLEEHAMFDAQIDRAIVLDRVGIGGYALGGALVLGGVIRWAVVARRSRLEVTASTGPGPGPGLSISGRF